MAQERSQHVVVLLARVKSLFHRFLGHSAARISVFTSWESGPWNNSPHKFSNSFLIFARRGPKFLGPALVEEA